MATFDRTQPTVNPVTRVIIPEAASYTLKNGIRVFLIEAGTEDVMRVEFTFTAGQVREKVPLLSSTVNMMLTEGSDKHTSEELNRQLDFYGAFLNPYSEKDRAGIVFFFLSKHTEKILGLSREIIFEPAFPEKELNALLKKRLRWFLNNREKVQNLASDKFYESVFGARHPYGYPLGESDFESISRVQAADFHKLNYNPASLVIIISGRINPDTVKILEDNFGSLPTGMESNFSNPLPEATAATKGIRVIKKGAVQTSVRIGSRTINKREPDYPGLKILNTILGGYFGSRLMKNIREDKGLTYGISSSLTSLDLSGFKVISTDVANRNCRAVLDEIYKEIENLRIHTVGRDELDRVRNYMSGEMLRMFDGPFALAESFRSAWEFGLDNSYYERMAEKIRTITPDEIKDLASTYYRYDDLFEITAGDE